MTISKKAALTKLYNGEDVNKVATLANRHVKTIYKWMRDDTGVKRYRRDNKWTSQTYLDVCSDIRANVPVKVIAMNRGLSRCTVWRYKVHFMKEG